MSHPGQEPLRLRVRNFMGVQRADIDITGIVLVSGINASGKSSLCEAAACVICSTPLARGMGSKKASAALLRHGTDKGSISLDYGGGSVRITYPDCEIEQSGQPATLGTPLGIGSARFMALNPTDRVRQFSDRFQTRPTLADLRVWAQQHPDAGLNDAPLIESFWAEIELHGWDAEWKAAAEHGTKLKGRWEGLSGVRWGSKLVRTWCPSPLLPGETYDLAEARKLQDAANQHLEELVGHAAVAEADVERLEQQSLRLEAVEREVATCRGTGTALAQQCEDIVAKKNAKDAPVDTATLPGCPHCGQKIRIVQDRERKYVVLEKAPEPMPAEELKVARNAIREWDVAIAALEAEIKANGARSAELVREEKACRAARIRLLEVKALPKVGPQQVEIARGQSLDAARKANAIDAFQRASAIVDDWTRHVMLTEALSPDGIRKTVMSRKLSAINGKLGEFSAVAKFADVALTDDLDCTYDGRPYTLLSESERWRCDLVLCCLFAQQEKARAVVIDRFDVLNPQARPGVLLLLRHVGIPALVAMTAREGSAVPDLDKAGFGTRKWLEQGVLQGVT